jgi:K+-transporting ATPase, c chain
MRDILLGALRLSLVTLVLCGLAYPLALTALGQWLLPWQANGSLKTDERGEIIGSLLIGQRWNGPEWFHGRPSATHQIRKTLTKPFQPHITRPVRAAPIFADKFRLRARSGCQPGKRCPAGSPGSASQRRSST